MEFKETFPVSCFAAVAKSLAFSVVNLLSIELREEFPVSCFAEVAKSLAFRVVNLPSIELKEAWAIRFSVGSSLLLAGVIVSFDTSVLTPSKVKAIGPVVSEIVGVGGY